MTMATESERIARIEGAYEHLATKADVEAVKTAVHDVRAEVQTVKTDLQTVNTEVQAVKTDLQTVKTELQTDIQTFKSDLRGEMQSPQVRTADGYTVRQIRIARRDSWNQERPIQWMKWALGIVVLGVLLPFLQSLLERLP